MILAPHLEPSYFCQMGQAVEAEAICATVDPLQQRCTNGTLMRLDFPEATLAPSGVVLIRHAERD